MPNSEFVNPSWRDGKAFSESLSSEEIQNRIKTELVRNRSDCHPLKERNPQEEINRYFPKLIKYLQIIDFNHFSYWITMLSLCFIFLLVELFLVGTVIESAKKLKTFQNIVLIGLTLSIGFVILYLYQLLCHLSNPESPKYLKNIAPDIIHAIPVIAISSFMVFAHYYLISKTGFSGSPFLPAFLCSSLIIISLPRKNSLIVIILTVAALLFGLFGSIKFISINPKELAEWGGNELANKLNLLAFIYSGISVFILRFIANFKIKMRQ